jgi:hypothetical protein
MSPRFKKAIKTVISHFWDFEDSRTSPQTKIALRHLYHYYTDRARNGTPLNIPDTGLRIFSQFEEDGILLAIFATIDVKMPGVFVDIGSGDGINSNCANLALNLGWNGVFIDGNSSNIKKGRKFYNNHPDTWGYPPQFVEALISKDNINEVIQKAGIVDKVDLLSIDLDGNEYWIWEALTCIKPRVVIIETHTEFGFESIVVPYNPSEQYPGLHPHYHGASLIAIKKLAEKKGYRLVGSNLYGFNTIHIRNDICENLIPSISVEKILNMPRNVERMKVFDEIKDWKYIRV